MAALRNILAAFRSACYIADNEEKKENFKYTLENGEFYNIFLTWCLKNLHKVFDYYLSIRKADQSNENRLPSSYPKWKAVNSIIKTFLKSLIHFYDYIKDPNMLEFILEHVIFDINHSQLIMLNIFHALRTSQDMD